MLVRVLLIVVFDGIVLIVFMMVFVICVMCW